MLASLAGSMQVAVMGRFGVDRGPPGAVRLLGIALLAAGTALVLRK